MDHLRLALVAALAGSSALVACGSNAAAPAELEGRLGHVELNLNVADGHTVASIHYAVFAGVDIDGVPPPVEEGDYNLSRAISASIRVNLVPGRYTVVAQASADDIPCSGQVTFDVAAGAEVTAAVGLTCVDPAAPALGGVLLDPSFSFEHPTCGVTEVLVAPLRMHAQGGLIALRAEGSAGLSWQWTVVPLTLGTFATPTAADGTFDCIDAGLGTLTVTARNPAQNCLETKSVTIECASSCVCGDGVVCPDEACEPPQANCNPMACEFYECGDGVVSGTEQCDDGNTVSGDGCDGACVLDDVVELSCDVCTEQRCTSELNGCSATANVDSVNGNRCQNLLACYEQNDCAVGGDTVPCVCGTFTEIECAGGEADGPCSSVARRAAGSGGSNSATLLTTLVRFTSDDYPIGDANHLFACNQLNCASCL